MSQTTELVLKAILGIAAALVVARRLDRGRRGRTVLGALALLSALAFFNFGTFHGARIVHHGELFHYVLGSKYFPELGYDGLYVASLQAQQESAPSYPWPERVRDLRTDRKVAPSELDEHRREVRARFDDRRWQDFVADHHYFLAHSEPEYVGVMRNDHGFNATPAWTTLARLLGGGLAVGPGTLALVATFDLALLVLLFGTVWRTFGFERAALSVTIFGLAFLSRYYWVGGSFLRFDWLCASVMGVCMIKRDRPVAAGVAFGLAAALRVFPALLLFGLGVWALRHWLRGKRSRWTIQLGTAFVVTVLCGVVLGAAAGRGLDGWTEFGEAIATHRADWSRNRVGFFNILVQIYDRLAAPLPSVDGVVPAETWQERVMQFRTQLWPLRALLVVGGLAAVARAAWSRSRVESAVLGLPAIFLLTEPTCYYWSLLLLVALIGRRDLTALVLSYSALLCVAALVPSVPVYTLAAAFMLALYALWLLPRDRPAAPGAATHAPAR